MGRINVDPLEFRAWQEGLEEDDLLHAYRAIKCLEAIQFKRTIGEDYDEEISAWIEK